MKKQLYRCYALSKHWELKQRLADDSSVASLAFNALGACGFSSLLFHGYPNAVEVGFVLCEAPTSRHLLSSRSNVTAAVPSSMASPHSPLGHWAHSAEGSIVASKLLHFGDCCTSVTRSRSSVVSRLMHSEPSLCLCTFSASCTD